MKTSKRLKALTRLGLAAGAFYVAPLMLQMDQASASGAISLATDPLTAQECSDCHPAYGPRYLRAYAWQKIMANLDDHFGEDATVDEDVRLKIEKYLVYNAGRPRKIGLRISEKTWFKKEHDARHISARMLEKAGSISNCTACHSVKK
ncbi:MAG: cytochrome C [Rhodospirillaceae bacterium]|nr:cytochrome C [Rhodospirillaceae bacterium]